MPYDPETARFQAFSAASAKFKKGSLSPREFLEQCLERLEAREGEVLAFVGYDIAKARENADLATARWHNGMERSPIDGLPFGVKDCFDVQGWRTGMNSKLFDDSPYRAVDAAHVYAIKKAGGCFVGKTTTTEWTIALPPPTWNPWDLSRTPGGSSAGSAAAVAAGMISIGTGSQVRGSGIRPASICGIPAFKPSFGALNRHGGPDPTPSLNHLVLLGASLADIWATAGEIAQIVGGDPGFATLTTGGNMPAATKPRRLLRQYTAGWDKTDRESQQMFEAWLGQLSDEGIAIIEPASDPEFAAYEKATTDILQWFFDLFREMIWPMAQLKADNPSAFSEPMHSYIDRVQTLTSEHYAAALDRREALRTMHRKCYRRVDGFVTLAHIGPGQVGQLQGGTPFYNDASSAIGAPSMNLPVLAAQNLPLGVQLMGFEGQDREMMGIGRWLIERTNGNLTGLPE